MLKKKGNNIEASLTAFKSRHVCLEAGVSSKHSLLWKTENQIYWQCDHNY